LEQLPEIFGFFADFDEIVASPQENDRQQQVEILVIRFNFL
jgi:hypothetical protein